AFHSTGRPSAAVPTQLILLPLASPQRLANFSPTDDTQITRTRPPLDWITPGDWRGLDLRRLFSADSGPSPPMQLAIAALIALLPIINPFSTAPMFLAITEGDTDAERRDQARKAVIYMICILVAFLIGGSFIMKFFGLSLPGLRIAGGILVAGVGMRMLYPRDDAGQT